MKQRRDYIGWPEAEGLAGVSTATGIYRRSGTSDRPTR